VFINNAVCYFYVTSSIFWLLLDAIAVIGIIDYLAFALVLDGNPRCMVSVSVGSTTVYLDRRKTPESLNAQRVSESINFNKWIYVAYKTEIKNEEQNY